MVYPSFMHGVLPLGMFSKYPSYIPKTTIPVYILSFSVLNDKWIKTFHTEIRFITLFLTYRNDSNGCGPVPPSVLNMAFSWFSLLSHILRKITNPRGIFRGALILILT